MPLPVPLGVELVCSEDLSSPLPVTRATDKAEATMAAERTDSSITENEDEWEHGEKENKSWSLAHWRGRYTVLPACLALPSVPAKFHHG